MAHELEKLVCPQCGGNDLTPFGNSAYKCQACGTILKDEQEVKAIETTHFVAPVSTDFTNDMERKEPELMNSEERYPTESELQDENIDGDTFLKTIAMIGVLVILAVIVWYLLK